MNLIWGMVMQWQSKHHSRERQNSMVEVFKTNVAEVNESKKIIQKLLQRFPEAKINFDLEDCDKILRVQGDYISIETVIEALNLGGFYCEILE